MDLSIIIVNYNTRNLTLQCLESIFNSLIPYKIEVFVVDNNSTDGSVIAIKNSYPSVIIIENKYNVGFSKANNEAIKKSRGRYVLLLNSDTIVQENTISYMVRFMDTNKKVGASGCRVSMPSGSLDKACHRGFPTPLASLTYFSGLTRLFPENPKINLYHKSYLKMDETHEIDCLVGAFMLVRREALKEIGLLNEDFFMYGEDIDWCYRIKEAGWKIYYVPEVSIIHYKGASSRKKPFKIVYEFHRAMYLFHRLHYHNKYNFIINTVVYSGIFTKLSLAVITNFFKKTVR